MENNLNSFSLQILLDSLPNAIILLNPKGDIVSSNTRAQALFGYPPEEIAGKPVERLIPGAQQYTRPENLGKYTASAQALASEKRFETNALRKDGSRLPVDISVTPFNPSADHSILLDIRDTTQRHQAEEAKHAAEKFSRMLFDKSIDAIFILDLQGQYLEVNPRAAQLLGYTQEELRRLSIHDLSAEVEQSANMLERVVQGEVISPYETLFRKKNGEVIPAEIHIELIRDNQGQPYRILSIVHDISEQKQADARSKRQVRRLDSLRRIFTAIIGSLDLQVVLDIVLDQTTSQLGIDAANVLLLNPHSQMLEYSAGRGFTTDILKYAHLRLGEGYAGQAALERRIVTIQDLRGRKTDFLRSPSFLTEHFVSYYAIPLIAKGKVVGVLEVFNRTKINPDPEWVNFLKILAEQVALALDNAQLFDNLQRANSDLFLAYEATIEGWSRALDLRDEITEGHTQRVIELTLALARLMKVSEADIVHMRRGGLLHDIGKIGIPDSILRKPAKLNEEEWKLMHQHPRLAYNMLSPIVYLRAAMDIPYCHHEKWDGSGYPRGLKGEEIPLAARIFAVVDVWDALNSNRPYQAAWTQAKALEHIVSLSGQQFDPRVVESFLILINQRLAANSGMSAL